MHGKNPLRPKERGDGLTLWIQEMFYTLQGEGPFAGQPSLFIRLGGCNLNCFFCDTEFESSTWKPSLSEILDEAAKLRPDFCNLIVITGGEPFRQNIAPLVEALLERGLRVQIETNGTLWVDLPESDRLFIVCSPKTSALNRRLVERISAYKYVISAGNVAEDGLPSASALVRGRAEILARPPVLPGRRNIYVMPLDEGEPERNAANLKACTESALKHGYYLTVQTHKIAGIR